MERHMDESTRGRGRLAGKVAMVTGAGSGADAAGVGIGEAIARLFAREGARVLAVDLDEARAARTVATITAEGGQATVHVADVSDSGQCKAAVDTATRSYGGLDVLVNNVGISVLGSVTDLDLDGYQKAMDVNLKSMVLTSRYAVPVMIKGGGGSIVNLSSIVGLRGGQFGGAIPYAVSKGGVVALTTAMAVDHGADGVRVNCIAPGHAYTPMVEGRVDARGRDLRRRAAPLQTEGTAWDMAHAALFLGSDDARWITGVTLPVDAGLLATTPLAMLSSLTD
jgi:NAD(P)-dependent dehydrogenase (short-subunit alcohol dehydrogenase family)